MSTSYDPDSFGRFSESIARTIGTARFLVWQTVVCSLWMAMNVHGSPWAFDGAQLQLLTLALSLQAAYAAPLILLAQSREQARDRHEGEHLRAQIAALTETTNFLARELMSVRIQLAGVPSRHPRPTERG